MSSPPRVVFNTGVSDSVTLRSLTEQRWDLGVEYEDAFIGSVRDSVSTS